ncbi:MAG: hypothetical protein AAB011_04340 [Candidatus Eisenbacteria bacterium]
MSRNDRPRRRALTKSSPATPPSELPEPLTEVYVGSTGRRLSFLLLADSNRARDLSGYAAGVTFWYEDAVETHVVRAARVDGPNGAVIYDPRGDEYPRKGIVLAQATVMSPDFGPNAPGRGFFQESSEIVAIKVLPRPVMDPRESQPSTSAPASGLRSHDRIDLVMPERCEIEIDTSTGESKVVSPSPGVVGAYTFFERSDPGQAWGDLFRTVATRLRLPWDVGTFLAMMTVFSQKAWERVPPREQQRYVAGSVLKETHRSTAHEEMKVRLLREREPLWGDLEAPGGKARPIEEALQHDPQRELEAESDWAARIERCREVLAEIDDWSPRQAQLKAYLEGQATVGEEISPAEAGRALGWSHEETMSTWQSLQRKAERAQRRLSGSEEK